MARLKNIKRPIFFGFLTLLFIGSPAWGGLNFPTAISVERSMYFQKPDGEPVQLKPGVYEVEQGGEALLTVHAVGAKASESIAIQAIPAGHDEELTEASADLIPSPDNNPDKPHLLLSMPNGLALEAVGTYSGVFSRSALTWSIKVSDEEAGSSEAPLMLDFEEAIYFKTVGGDPKAIQPGHYEVTKGDNGLLLTPTGEFKGEPLNIETESLGTSAAVMLPEFDDNPDLELLMLGTASGQSLVAIGSHSGTFPRGFFKKLGRGIKKVGGGIKKGAQRVGGGVKKGVSKAGGGIKRGVKFAHGKVKRHVVKHVKKGVRTGLRHAKKYGRKVAVGAYKVTKRVGKEVVKFCTGSVSAAHTCYKVGKMAVVAAAS